MNEDIKWFLGLLVLLALLWWGGRGALQSGYGNAGGSNPSATESNAPPSASEQIKAAETQVTKLKKDLAQAQAEQNASPLKGKLTILSLVRGGSASAEYLAIQASSENTAPVVITGLSVRSAGTGNEAKIPTGWKLPFLGSARDGEVVALAPGESAYLISGTSPVGFSFETNRCIGYITGGTLFNPPVGTVCPAAASEPLPQPPNHLSDACLDFLEQVPACTLPTVPLSLSGDGSCQAFIQKQLNYNACVSTHKNDAHFYQGRWFLYLNRTSRFWRDRNEAAELRDTNGKLIDAQSYQ